MAKHLTHEEETRKTWDWTGAEYEVKKVKVAMPGAEWSWFVIATIKENGAIWEIVPCSSEEEAVEIWAGY